MLQLALEMNASNFPVKQGLATTDCTYALVLCVSLSVCRLCYHGYRGGWTRFLRALYLDEIEIDVHGVYTRGPYNNV